MVFKYEQLYLNSLFWSLYFVCIYVESLSGGDSFIDLIGILFDINKDVFI